MSMAKWEYLMQYIELDENGCSRVYTLEEIIQYGNSIGVDLSFGNGSSYARTDTAGVFQLNYDYVLIKEKGFNYNVPHFDENGNLIPKATGKNIAIQFLGKMTDEKRALRAGQTHDHAIPKHLRNECLARDKCCVFTGATTNLECDHKNGRYPKASSELTANDLQMVCKSVNVSKRSKCKSCAKTNKRFDARIIGYPVGWTIGNEQFDASLDNDEGCKGCFLYDPKQFRKELYEGCICQN